jgi:transcriptional regulator with XRE-family HTH domain
MGRPTTNANHPLYRLRVQLSTKPDGTSLTHQMTRAELAEKTGVPEPTLKDIELKKFRLSLKIAMRISITTGVDAESLLRADNPLLDLESKPVTHQTRFKGRKMEEPFKHLRSLIYETAWEVADERGMAGIVDTRMQDSLVQVFSELRLNKALADKLEKLQSSEFRFSSSYLKRIRDGRTWVEELEAREKVLKRQTKPRSVVAKAA